MKKALIFALLLISTFGFSQENKQEEIEPKKLHEIKLNAIFLVAGAFEATYERIINEETSVGVSVMLPFAKNVKESIKYYISPYYRKFLSSKYASGYFLELFGSLNSMERSLLLEKSNKFYTDFGLGIGFGHKWKTKAGFVVELNLGIGRNLFKDDENLSSVFGKFALGVGYRF